MFSKVLLAASLITAPLFASAPPAELVGTWGLESFVVTRPDGSKVDWCRGAHGFITYTESGYVSVAINCVGETSPEAPSAKFSNMLHYAGSYEVKGRDIVHHLENASYLPLIGQTVTRNLEELTDDTLVLGGNVGGPFRIVWKRL